METTEWPVSDYAIGSYIQSVVADTYLPHLTIKPSDDVLDVGCGDGRYSLKIIQSFPMASFVGIDGSKNMLNAARKNLAHCPTVSLKQADVMALPFDSQFDYVISFWCLQWAREFKTALQGIHRALRPGGKVLIVVPAGDDPLINTFHHMKASGDFPLLDQFRLPIDYPALNEVLATPDALPFSQSQVAHDFRRIELPSLDTYRKFLNGVAFFQGQVPDPEIHRLNEAMVSIFDKTCRTDQDGKYWFEFTSFCLIAEK